MLQNRLLQDVHSIVSYYIKNSKNRIDRQFKFYMFKTMQRLYTPRSGMFNSCNHLPKCTINLIRVHFLSTFACLHESTCSWEEKQRVITYLIRRQMMIHNPLL